MTALDIVVLQVWDLYMSSRQSAGKRFLRELSYLPVSLIAKAAIPLNLSYRVRLRAAGTMPA